MKNLITQLKSLGLHPPGSLTLAITNQCNLYCKHCWPESGPCDYPSAVPLEALKKIIKEFADIGTEKIIFTGGEPLLYPALYDILNYTCKHQAVKEICLQTNAVLLTRIHAQALADFKEKISFRVSLEGADPKKHDYIRGKGSFERTVNGLNLLLEYGFGQQTCIAFTEMAHNFEDMAGVLDLAFKMGIGSFVSNTLICGGRAAHKNQLKAPLPSQYIKLLNLFHNNDTFKTQYQQIGNIAAIEWKKGQETGGKDHCCTFIENPYITSKGMMYPCVMLHSKEYAAKDVYSRPLHKAFTEAVPGWIKLHELSQNRAFALDSCQKCPGLLHCAAGCMGRAFTANGNFMSIEDRCSLRRAVYNWTKD
ncbi:Radical SAM and SPASM domains-containing protein [Desulfonema limicola]|uniref:Radical SAM and SPASM domains-containing protein n=1 Tax=Desulfonema limicola TaxID=45656 RepID=A0A975BA16_9BACT|nr:radical SAM protein [Desulfonema limicola]QTA81422.1 Radical SAM and SPASM domains-containing protein [Desulfonema limicola]